VGACGCSLSAEQLRHVIIAVPISESSQHQCERIQGGFVVVGRKWLVSVMEVQSC